ncbi:MAG: Fic family protein [Nitrospira sp.]
MRAYGEWILQAASEPATSFDAHYRLVAIHLFADGNGRTARLVMNGLLLRGGYPPVAVQPEDRKAYLDTLEHASMREDLTPFQTFMHVFLIPARCLILRAEAVSSPLQVPCPPLTPG